jgi:hypothetical protein
MRSPRLESDESFSPAAVLGSLKTVFAPAVVGGDDGVFGGAVVGFSADGATTAGVAGPLALDVESDERVAKTPAMAPPMTTTIARTISTIAVVDRPLLAGGAYE